VSTWLDGTNQASEAADKAVWALLGLLDRAEALLWSAIRLARQHGRPENLTLQPGCMVMVLSPQATAPLMIPADKQAHIDKYQGILCCVLSINNQEDIDLVLNLAPLPREARTRNRPRTPFFRRTGPADAASPCSRGLPGAEQTRAH
jgi:hypothetical protein